MPAPRPPSPPQPPAPLPLGPGELELEPEAPTEALRERLEHEAEVARDPASRAAILTALAELVWGETKDDGAALPILERAFEADATHLPALEALFRIHRRRDDREALERVARARAVATPAGPARAEALADLAETLEDLVAEPAGADEAWNAAAEEDPTSRIAWMALERRAAAKLDRPALRIALEGLARATTDPMRRGLYLVDAARIALESGEGDAAVALAREAAAGPAGRWRFLEALEEIAETVGDSSALADALSGRAAIAEAASLAPGTDPDASALALVRTVDAATGMAVLLNRRAARVLLDRMGDAPRAEAALDAARRIRPDDRLVADDTLRVLEATGRLDAVRGALERDLAAGETGPAAAALRCRLADVALRVGDPVAARDHLVAARAASPTSVAARALLEEEIVSSGDFAALADLYAADADATRGPVRAFSATIAADAAEGGAKDPARALDLWKTVMEASSDSLAPRAARIDLLRRLDRPTDLATDLEALTAVDVGAAEAAALFGEAAVLRAKAGDLDGARKSGELAVEKTPDALAPRLRLAFDRLAAGDRAAAARAFAAAAPVASEDGLAAALGCAAAALGADDPPALASEARSRAPEDPLPAALELELLIAKGRASAAVEALGRIADAGGPVAPAARLEAVLMAEKAGLSASDVSELLTGLGDARWTDEVRLAFARGRRDDEAVGAILESRASDGPQAALGAGDLVALRLGRSADAAALYRESGAAVGPDDPAFPGRWSTSSDPLDVAALAAVAADAGPPAFAGALAATALAIAGPSDAGDPERLETLARTALSRTPADPTPLLWSAWLAAAKGDAAGRRAALEALPPSAAATATELLAARVAGAPGAALAAIARRLHTISPQHAALGVTLADGLAPGESPAARLAGLLILRELAPPVARVDLDVEIGETLDSLGMTKEAEASFRTALGACAEDLAAIFGVRRTIRAGGDPAEVAALTERAAVLVGEVPEAAPLWEEAGLLLEDALGKPTRAEKMYARALALDIGRAEAYKRIHTLLEERGGFDELADLLARRSAIVDDPDRLVPLLLEQSAVAEERGDSEEAVRALEEALLLEPENLDALGRKPRILAAMGEHENAVEAYLAEAAVLPPAGKRRARADAARILAGPLGDPTRAVVVLFALEEDGALEVADLETAATIAERAHLVDLRLAALRKIAEIHPDFAGRVDAHRRAAVVLLAERRGDEAALELRRLLAIAPDDLGALVRHAEIVVDPTARRLPLEPAEARVRERLAEDPASDPALSLLARIYGWEGDRDLRWLVLSLREALGLADDAEREEVASLVQVLPDLPSAPVAIDRLNRAIVRRDEAGPGGAVLDAIAPFLGKYFDLSTKRLGVGRGERLSPKAPSILRQRVASWAEAFGVGELEVYVGGSDLHRIAVVPGDPPAVVVGAGVSADLDAPSRFAIGRALHRIHRGRAALHGRSPEELVRVLWAAARIGGAEAPEDPALAAAALRLGDALSRKVRNGLAEIVPAFVALPDPMSILHAERTSSARAGLVACGDARVALAAVAAGTEGRDLVRFAISHELALLRREMGLSIR